MIDSTLSLFRNPGIVVDTRRVGKKNQSSVGFKAHSQPELAHKVSFVMTNEYAYVFPHMLTPDRRPPPEPEINKHDKRIRNKTKQEFCSFLRLTVRFLVTSTSTWTTELLGLGPSGIGDEKCAVVLEESLLELVLGVLVNELLVVGDDGLGDGLADGVDLGDVTTTGDADTDIDTGELVEADDQKGLVDLEAELLGLDEVKRLAVDLDEALALLGVGDCGSSLLLAEALHTLRRSHGG